MKVSSELREAGSKIESRRQHDEHSNQAVPEDVPANKFGVGKTRDFHFLAGSQFGGPSRLRAFL